MAKRPAEFDDALRRYMPMLRAMAATHLPIDTREDVIQETLTSAVAGWEKFRGTYERGGGFVMWLRWQFMSALSHHKHRSVRSPTFGDIAALTIGTEATQSASVEAMDILRRLEGRDGEVLLRRGMGYSQQEIGDAMGVGYSRVQQLEARERERLMKVAA